MKFGSTFINSHKLYSIGIDEDSGKYCMAVIITWIASYARYFELTKDEFDLHKSDIGKLDAIAEKFRDFQNPKDSGRLLHSEMANEN
jgi:hypothetical protein